MTVRLSGRSAAPRYAAAVASRSGEAERLLAEVRAERLRARADRPSQAIDNDLGVAAALLSAAARADASESRSALLGRISRVVVDAWSLDSPLSEDLVAFDHHFMAP
jgi:hypothetical protein